MTSGYTKKEYSLFDKTLYVQRLLFAIDNDYSHLDEYAQNAVKQLKQEANRDIDNAIEDLQNALEVTGFFPQIREVSSQSPSLWRQPVRITTNKKESQQ